MQKNNVSIAEFSTEEYDYFTEFVDFNSGSATIGTRFLIYNRQRKFATIVKMVMKNELTDFERNVVTEYWCDEKSAEKIIEKYGISRSAFYRIIENVRKKIENSLKYVMLYDEVLIPKSTEEILEYVRKYEN